ncbi:sulfatase [Sphingomonas aracearum]|uniref:sulfatase family protein n=1 Tax=Sphingomonas aracearum TaxID=2283317 RepID=UPI001EEF9B6D|nr:sulfatase [Sphingomonas aracearum]
MASARQPAGGRRPNFIVILCDDLGYGDIGPMGGRTIRTPNLDRMAAQGMTLTDYYAPANVCTPSRAGLLTGRYPVRTGLGYQVILQNDARGLPLSETTMFEALKPDYATALIGKWHLGHVPPAWPPTQHGIDLFYGIPYSHDMTPLSLFESQGPGRALTQSPVDLPMLQQQFYARAERFIEDNQKRPFLLELALSAPHLPEHPNPAFRDRSDAAAYGDVVEEIDALVGRLTAKLNRLGLARDTLVLFTSDNGPWFEGSAGPLRQRKGGGGYDGGYRVPCLAWQPGVVPAGRRSDAIAMGIDFLPTFCAMAGKPLSSAPIDGRDLTGVLTRNEASPHDQLVLFDNEDPVAIRTQRWKFVSNDYYRGRLFPTDEKYPQLYDVQHDASESYSVANRHAEVLADMRARLKRARADFAPFKSSQIPAAFQRSASTHQD